MKKIIALLTALVIMATLTVPASAACQTPGCVKKAALTAMDENDIDLCLVIKLEKGCSGKGTAYMMYRKNGKAHCDRSGQIIVGKNSKVRKNFHYFVNRNRNYEKDVTSWKKSGIQYRTRWNTIVECAEDSDFNLMIHSYIEYKNPGKAWQTCKGTSKNTDGVSMCKEFAHYLWSMADDDCPVVFKS